MARLYISLGIEYNMASTEGSHLAFKNTDSYIKAVFNSFHKNCKKQKEKKRKKRKRARHASYVVRLAIISRTCLRGCTELVPLKDLTFNLKTPFWSIYIL